jgi:hypothetical protein
MTRPVCHVVVGAVLFLVPRANAGDKADVRALVSQGNRAALEAIQTYYAQVECSTRAPDGKVSEVHRGEYWRDQDTVRVRQVEGDSLVDTLVGKEITRTLITARGPRGQAGYQGSIAAKEGLHTLVDAWYCGLCKLSVDFLPLYDLLNRPWDRINESAVRQDGLEIYHVEFTRGSYRLEVWVDPAVNYLVRKAVAHSPGFREESTVLHFREVEPALFLPERIEHRFILDGKLSHTVTTLLQGIKVNHPLPSELFRLRFPAGTFVVDSVQGLSYVVDENEQPVGQPRKMEQGIGPMSPAARTPTVEEPNSSLQWWILGLLIPPTLVGACWVVRQRVRSR